MTDKLKKAFDCIRAEENLKSDTALFLEKEIQKRKRSRPVRFNASRFNAFGRYAAALVSVLLLCLSGMFAYGAYFSPAAYVDLDINPSIELTLNRFDRIIDVRAYNDDGEETVGGLAIKYKGCGDALIALMETVTDLGYFQNAALVSVTVQTADKNKEKDLLTDIQTGIESYLAEHRHAAQLDVFPVNSDTRSHSHELGLTPAKYLAIQELIEVDPTASIENCRGHSISEIKRLTKEHGNHHGGNGNNGNGNNGNGNGNGYSYSDSGSDGEESHGRHGAGCRHGE